MKITQQDRDRVSLAFLSLVAGGLTFLAVLLLLSGVAQARSTSLPSHFLGEWCTISQVETEGGQLSTHIRIYPPTKCAEGEDLLKIEQSGVLFYGEDWCSFRRAERSTVRTWRVQALCKPAGSSKGKPVTMIFEGWEGNNVISIFEPNQE
jgi:hypothetical protein